MKNQNPNTKEHCPILQERRKFGREIKQDKNANDRFLWEIMIAKLSGNDIIRLEIGKL